MMKNFVSGAPSFVAEFSRRSDEIEIRGDEAKHILQARRMTAGQEIFLTNGEGLGVRGEIISLERRAERVVVKPQQWFSEPRRTPPLTLATALPKGDRPAIIFRMATELGVAKIIPLQCEFSNHRLTAKSFHRWHKIIAEAGKQSRRLWFPELTEPLSVAAAVNLLGARDVGLLGDPQGGGLEGLEGIANAAAIFLFVGPEGGFSAAELAHIARGNVIKLRLGSHILRTETAALALTAVTNQYQR